MTVAGCPRGALEDVGHLRGKIMARLTKRKIDSSRTVSGKEIRLWDDDPRGLGIRIKPSGAKTFFVQYRSPVTDKKVRHTIGQYGRLTLDEARIEAAKVLGAVARDHDPAREKRLARNQARINAKTMTEFCALYLRDAKAGLVTYRGRPKKASTLSVDEGRIKRHIVPLLGDMLIGDVTPNDVENFMHSVRLGETAVTVKTGPRGIARVRGGEGTARRTVGLLGSIFSYAVRKGLRPDNPCRDVERSPDARHERHLSPGEYRSLAVAVEELRSLGVNPVPLDAIWLIALTGARKGEILSLTWPSVDFEGRALHLEDTKTGPQTRPIGRAALDFLADLKRNRTTAEQAARESMDETARREFDENLSKLIFPAIRGEGGYGGLQKIFEKVRESAELTDVTLKTFRHGFASVAGELHYSDVTIGAMLGHRSNTITGRYTHIVDPAVASAADRVSVLIAARMLNETEDAAKVVEFPRSAT